MPKHLSGIISRSTLESFSWRSKSTRCSNNCWKLSALQAIKIANHLSTRRNFSSKTCRRIFNWKDMLHSHSSNNSWVFFRNVLSSHYAISHLRIIFIETCSFQFLKVDKMWVNYYMLIFSKYGRAWLKLAYNFERAEIRCELNTQISKKV